MKKDKKIINNATYIKQSNHKIAVVISIAVLAIIMFFNIVIVTSYKVDKETMTISLRLKDIFNLREGNNYGH